MTSTTSRGTAPNKKKANIAVIGAGWWCQGWHLPHLSRNEEVMIAAIVDASDHPTSNLNPNLESLDALGKKYGAPVYPCVSKLLQELGPTLDGALVATPHATHYQVGRLLLEEGMKRKQDNGPPLHILMEKPMTTNVEQAKQFVQLVTEYQKEENDSENHQHLRPCFLINHSANYRTQAKAARSLVESGILGDVRHISAFLASPLSWIFEDKTNTGWNEPTSDMVGNGFGWGQCSHLLGWIFHVCPQLKPEKVFCRMNHSKETGADVSHAATITCSCGDDNDNVVLGMSGTCLLPGYEHSDPPVGKQVQIKIYGSKGALIYTGVDNDPESGKLELRRVDSDGVVEYPCGNELGFDFEELDQNGTGPHSLQSFIQACLGRSNYYVGADVELGFRTVQTLEAMYRSNSTKGVEDVRES